MDIGSGRDRRPTSLPPRRRLALIVEDSISEGALLTSLTREEGLHVVHAVDAESALVAIEAHGPDVILLDVHLPGPNGTTLLAQIREEHPFLPVLLMSSRDECQDAETAGTVGAVAFVRKPIRAMEFRAAVQQMVGALGEEQARCDELMRVIDRHTSLTVPGDPALLPRVVGYLGREVRNHYPGAELPLPDIKLALYEALLNAIEHGNLEIGSERKSFTLENGTGYRRLVAERLHQAPYASRRVHLEADYHADRVVYRVRDEGKGFDPKALDPHAIDTDRLHGRGIHLILHAMTDVEWNDDGTEIRMTRALGP